MTKTSDFLVIGSGLAGLMYALKVSKFGKVIIVTKSKIIDTNTNHAQGGIASVVAISDSFDKHIKDTLTAGDGLCDIDVVKTVVTEGPVLVNELIELGVNFDKNGRGEYDLGREGGHSENRIYHYKDCTGAEIQRALTEQVLNNPNIEVYEGYFAVDLITQHHLGYHIIENASKVECYGAYVLNPENKKVERFLSKITFIATGGIGNIYEMTTNPVIATGDGIAMANRAKALITDMEFVQFHPTALYNKNERPSFLITEALRGFGAILRNKQGEAFMSKYDSRKDLAPRDIVARAIDTEIKISGDEHVYLDATHLNPEELKSHFPNIYKKCLTLVAANGAAVVAAIVQATRPELWYAEWLGNVAVLEPWLTLQLCVLYAIQPWLARLPYATGAWAVAGLTVACGVASHALIGATGLVRGSDLLRALLLGLVLAGLLIAYFRLRAKALSPSITEARLQALQARIRPHFLFNSINAVLSLVRTDPRRAEGALEDMADLFRVLMRDNRELTPLADEVELCRQYLALEKLRLGDRLQVEWHLNSMPGDALVPPLVLQPLLENAVYHGIEPSSAPGVVYINIFFKGGDVHAILRNPYQANGGKHHLGNKMAIANVRERLALHFDAEGSLESKVLGNTYEVHMRMPYRPASSRDAAPRARAATTEGEAPKPSGGTSEPLLRVVTRNGKASHG